METNPFITSGDLPVADMIGRDDEARHLLALAAGGHCSRLVAPRRYGKTNLLRRVLADAAVTEGMPTALVDLKGVDTMADIVVQIEQGYRKLPAGSVRKAVERTLRSWELGVGLSGPGFGVAVHSNPKLDVRSVLLRLLTLPEQLARKHGRSVIAFDEFHDLLRVPDADSVLRSVIQHQTQVASYLFAGSEPRLMKKLFDDPSRPFLAHAHPLTLGPLRAAETGDYIIDRFARSGRDPGDALAPLLTFTRGHPQRTMLCAFSLWEETAPGEPADEQTWVRAFDAAFAEVRALVEANWDALPVNEQKLSKAMAIDAPTKVEAYRRVGLNRTSVTVTQQRLRGRAEVVEGPRGLVLADPMLERWLHDSYHRRDQADGR